MGAFMIHHSEELMVSQHLEGAQGLEERSPQPKVYGSASKPRSADPHISLQPLALGLVLCPVCLPGLGSYHLSQGLCPQMTAARGRGWNNSSPKILKMDPDNGPHHGEDTGHPCEGQRRVEEKEAGREHRESIWRRNQREGERQGWTLRAATASHTGCSPSKDSPRATEAVCLRGGSGATQTGFFFSFMILNTYRLAVALSVRIRSGEMDVLVQALLDCTAAVEDFEMGLP